MTMTMTVDTTVYSAPNMAGGMDLVPIELIHPSGNPRRHFDPVELEELAESIRQHGIIEPIVVRPATGAVQPVLSDDRMHATMPRWYIIAGERRWRAAKLAGLAKVPVVFRGPMTDTEALKLALIENLHRKDLDPLEAAEGYRALSAFGLKQAQIAAAVNLSQPTIANRLRLLDLPDDVQEMIRSAKLTPAHGVALARHKEWPSLVSALATIAVRENLRTNALEADPTWHITGPLEKAGAIKGLSPYARAFDASAAGCPKCPFGAYRNWPDGTYCLNPPHWQELESAAVKAKAASLATTVAKAVEKAKEKGEELPKLNDLPPGSAQEVRGEAPTGCSVDCVCRSAAIDWHGAVVPICTDARRYQLLERRTTIARNKARHDDAKALGKRLIERVDSLTELDERGLRIIASQAIGDDVAGYMVNHGYRKACERRGWKSATFGSASVKELSEVSALDATTLALESILLGELDGYNEGSRGSAHLTRYFLGDDPGYDVAAAQEQPGDG